MKVYYAGSVNLATGALIHPGNARGSETSNPSALGLALNESLNEPSFDSLFKWVFGLTWQWQTFDFNRHVDMVDEVLAKDLNATSTDLRAFADRGGKLVMYAGWADPLIPSQSSINYYNALSRKLWRHPCGERVEEDAGLRAALHGAGHVALQGRTGAELIRRRDRAAGAELRRAVRSADLADAMGRAGRRAELGDRNEIQQRHAAAGHRDAAADLLVSD